MTNTAEMQELLSLSGANRNAIRTAEDRVTRAGGTPEEAYAAGRAAQGL